MATMSDEHQAALAEMVQEYGLMTLMATLFGDGEVATVAKASVGAKMSSRERRANGRRDKERYIARANDEYPEWGVGDGKGFRTNALKKALETGEEPKRTPLSGYMVFLAQERPTLKKEGFTGKETTREGGRRWGELTPEQKLDYTNQGREEIGLEPKELKVDTDTDDVDGEEATPSKNTRSQSKAAKAKSTKAAKAKSTKTKAKKAASSPRGSDSVASVASSHSSKKSRHKTKKPTATVTKTVKVQKNMPKQATPSTQPEALKGMFDTDDDSDSSDEE